MRLELLERLARLEIRRVTARPIRLQMVKMVAANWAIHMGKQAFQGLTVALETWGMWVARVSLVAMRNRYIT